MKDLKYMKLGEDLPFGFKVVKCMEPLDTDDQCIGRDLSSLCKSPIITAK